MKQLLFFLLVSISLPVFGQNIPDTIWVEQVSDSSFVIAIGTKNRRNNKMNIEYLDQVYDSAGVADFAFNRISRNEQNQRDADLIKLESDALTSLYADINSILQAYTGQGYLQKARAIHGSVITGVYRARLNGNAILLEVNSDGTAIQVDQQRQPVQNGYTGTWNVITQDRWRLNSFFPVSVLPSGAILNRINAPENTFMAVGSNLVVTKISD